MRTKENKLNKKKAHCLPFATQIMIPSSCYDSTSCTVAHFSNDVGAKLQAINIAVDIIGCPILCQSNEVDVVFSKGHGVSIHCQNVGDQSLIHTILASVSIHLGSRHDQRKGDQEKVFPMQSDKLGNLYETSKYLKPSEHTMFPFVPLTVLPSHPGLLPSHPPQVLLSC